MNPCNPVSTHATAGPDYANDDDGAIAADIAGQDPTLDGPVPGDFEPCPLCAGVGCPDCDGRGRVHPLQADWLQEEMVRLQVPLVIVEDVLAHPELPAPTRRSYEWYAAESERAAALPDEWAAAGPDLAAVLRAVGWEPSDASATVG
jgi:hypothetical protein